MGLPRVRRSGYPNLSRLRRALGGAPGGHAGLALERDPREHAVEPGGQRPGAVAEQCHHRRRDDHAHHQHVDQDRGGEAEADRLDDHVGIGDEAEEHARHDHAGREDDPAHARHRPHDALLRAPRRACTPRGCATAGRRCSPSIDRTGSRT